MLKGIIYSLKAASLFLFFVATAQDSLGQGHGFDCIGTPIGDDPNAGLIGTNGVYSFCGPSGTITLGSAGDPPAATNGTLEWLKKGLNSFENSQDQGIPICDMVWSPASSSNTISDDYVFIRRASIGTAWHYSNYAVVHQITKPDITNAPGDHLICSGFPVIIDPTFSGFGEKIQVQYDDDGDGLDAADPYFFGPTFNQTHTNDGIGISIVEYRVRAYNPEHGGCYGQWHEFDVSVFPSEIPTVGGHFVSGGECGGGEYNISLNSSFGEDFQFVWQETDFYNTNLANVIDIIGPGEDMSVYHDAMGGWNVTNSNPTVDQDKVFVARSLTCDIYSDAVVGVTFRSKPGFNNAPDDDTYCKTGTFTFVPDYNNGGDQFKVFENGTFLQQLPATFEKTYNNTGYTKQEFNYEFIPVNLEDGSTCDGPSTTFTITVRPEPKIDANTLPTHSWTSGGLCHGGTVDFGMTDNNHSENIHFQWKTRTEWDQDPTSTTGWSQTGPTGFQVTENIVYRVVASENGCPNDFVSPDFGFITLHAPVDPPANLVNANTCIGNSVDLRSNNVNDRWYDSDGNPLTSQVDGTGTIFTTGPLNSTGVNTYYVEGFNPSTNCPSATRTPVTVTVGDPKDENPCDPDNWIETVDVLVAGITSSNQIGALDLNDIACSKNYFDGLGRSIQSVSFDASPAGADIVIPIDYDRYSRQDRDYLPYATTARPGMRKLKATDDGTGDYTQSDQYQFYQTAANVEFSTAPFAEKILEDNPLNRVMKQGAPGTAWQPDGDPSTTTDNTIKIKYQTNVANEVYKWDFNEAADLPFANTGNERYIAGELTRNVTYDENSHQVIEFADKRGQVILKKVEDGDGGAETYYVYDDYGNLRTVIPPRLLRI